MDFNFVLAVIAILFIGSLFFLFGCTIGDIHCTRLYKKQREESVAHKEKCKTSSRITELECNYIEIKESIRNIEKSLAQLRSAKLKGSFHEQ